MSTQGPLTSESLPCKPGCTPCSLRQRSSTWSYKILICFIVKFGMSSAYGQHEMHHGMQIIPLNWWGEKWPNTIYWSNLLWRALTYHPKSLESLSVIQLTDGIYCYRERVRSMFYHGYDSYMKYGYPYDELKPLSCSGHDTWGR